MHHRKVRQDFENNGKAIAEWAREKGFKPRLVYAVISGQLKGKRGISHRIAVELGLKKRPDLAA